MRRGARPGVAEPAGSAARLRPRLRGDASGAGAEVEDKEAGGADAEDDWPSSFEEAGPDGPWADDALSRDMRLSKVWREREGGGDGREGGRLPSSNLLLLHTLCDS